MVFVLVGVRLLLQDRQEAFLVELSGRVSADSLVGHLSPKGLKMQICFLCPVSRHVRYISV